MIGTRFYKGDFSDEEYLQAAEWCNENQTATIEDMGEYYEVVPIVSPVISLEELKQEKIQGFKNIRDRLEVEPVQTEKGLFDYDDKSRDRLAIARQALEDAGGGSIVWTTADNQRVPMEIADFAAINGQAAIRSNALHVKYNELKTYVNEAETKEEVEHIIWGD